ncbi:MAG: hypothetical protein JW910_14270 [Anaerolineae bacterium]|nr:hypothetical protein [Anaerolineae bacterium]
MDTRTPTPGQQRAAQLDRLYRRISELDDASLAEIDALTSAAERLDATQPITPPAPRLYPARPHDTQPSMPPVRVTPDRREFTRRAFVLSLLAAGVVTAASGAAAILTGSDTRASEAAIPTTSASLSPPTLHGEPPTPAPPTVTPGPAPQVLIDDLTGQLNNARAEHLALRAQLDVAQDELARLNNQLAAQQAEVTTLQQLVALYEQLEAAGLDEAVATGMTPLWLAVQAISAGRDLLAAGVQEAARLLATVEAQSPAIANGLIWLEAQVSGLSRLLQDLEDALSDFFEPVRPVTDQIGDFIGQILDMLPFGMGEQIRTGLDAIAALLTHIPELVASINPLLITPLRQWVSPEDSEKGLVAEVVQPISSNLITPAQTVVDNSATLETTYLNQFQTPVEQALARRAAIRAELTRLGIT